MKITGHGTVSSESFRFDFWEWWASSWKRICRNAYCTHFGPQPRKQSLGIEVLANKRMCGLKL